MTELKVGFAISFHFSRLILLGLNLTSGSTIDIHDTFSNSTGSVINVPTPAIIRQASYSETQVA